ncbi:sensor histidine kinase [Compostimonas suwonensis]|uniref:Signal transduction histidine kinase n=1 Tax=Compostimonas suwonensis TaxID=1048394 RepID=A0A2M9BCY1_9MICO|nr:histidine kinase [Compostimonas suwonensis]PJJ55764.1 signal transduction histidine kinase [Compostimonas suwonensis]
MKSRSWWDLAVGASTLVLAVIVGVGYTNTPDGRWGAWAVLAVVAVCYASFGRRGIPDGDSPTNIPFTIVLIAGTALGVYFTPNMLTYQVIVLPLLWCLAGSTRNAIVLNAIATALFAVAFVAGQGGGWDLVGQAVFIQGLSFAFSAVFGLWISNVYDYGEERARLLEELTAAQDELAALHREAGAVGERERLAREIHDTIAQSLTSIVMLAQRMRASAGTGTGTDTDTGGRSIADPANAAPTGRAAPLDTNLELIESTARDALADARALVSTLAPVGSGGLEASLTRLARRFERETGIRVASAVEANGLSRELEVVLLRCAQEGLANIRKHSGADAAWLTVERRDDVVRLTLRDDGVGIAEDALDADRGFGLAGMRERLALVGGELEVGPGAAAPRPDAASADHAAGTTGIAGTGSTATDSPASPPRPGTTLAVTIPATPARTTTPVNTPGKASA